MRIRQIASVIVSAGICLAASAGVEDLPVTEHDGRLCHYYVVQPKETVYSLSKQLGITTEQLIEANPQVAEGLKAHATLYFPVTDADKRPRTITHTVAKGETIYGLSKQLGVSIDELMAQNPSTLDGLRAGQTITVTIPAAAAAESADAQAPAEPAASPVPAKAEVTVAPEEEAAPTPATTPVVAAVEQNKPLKIAMLLPFMLSQEKPDKGALRFTEFYKGFLLAADTLRNEGRPVSILAFDTANSTDTVAAILKRPEMQGTTLIIAPDSDSQLGAIADWALDNGAMVLNNFVVRDRLHLANPRVMQSNLPHALMYDRAIDALLERYPRHRLVVLKRADGPEDHREFIDELNLRLNEKGIGTPPTVTFSDKLTGADLAQLGSEEPVMFIPVSGKQSELNRILPALIEKKAEAALPDDVLLFGYPEWITYRGETFDNMLTMNTTVYSRFYNDTESADTKRIEESFARWFGSQMEQAVPRQGLLGFDTGMMAIRALRRNGGDFTVSSPVYRGVQNGFSFRRADGSNPASGWVNDVLYFINFRPGGLIERTML